MPCKGLHFSTKANIFQYLEYGIYNFGTKMRYNYLNLNDLTKKDISYNNNNFHNPDEQNTGKAGTECRMQSGINIQLSKHQESISKSRDTSPGFKIQWKSRAFGSLVLIPDGNRFRGFVV